MSRASPLAPLGNEISYFVSGSTPSSRFRNQSHPRRHGCATHKTRLPIPNGRNRFVSTAARIDFAAATPRASIT